MDERTLHNLAIKVANEKVSNPDRNGFVELYGTERLIERYRQLADKASKLECAGLLKDSLFNDISNDLFVASSRYNSELNTICDTIEKAIIAAIGIYYQSVYDWPREPGEFPVA